MRSSIRTLPLAFLAVIASCTGPGGRTGATGDSTAHSPARPNILFLISDDHSGDALGVAGNPVARTPALDGLARAGTRFLAAYTASPQCSPARAAIVTGRSPHATGSSRLHATLTTHETLLDSLSRDGYFLAAFRKVHLGEAMQKRWHWYGGDDVPFERFFDERPRDKPFFLWVGFHDPHRPYEPGAISPPTDPARVPVPPFLPDTPEVRSDLALYYDEIARMDGQIGQLLARLDSDGLANDTVVVFAGDNGMPFPGAKGSLYHAGVNVPLVMRWPNHISPGVSRADIVSLLDLAPTLLDIAGVAPLPRIEGRSLWPSMRVGGPGAALETRPAFFERNWHDNFDIQRGVRSGRYLLVQNYRPELPYPPTLDLAESASWRAIAELQRRRALPAALERRYFAVPRPEVELYDVEADPGQLRDLAREPAHAETVRWLQQALSEWMVATSDFAPPPIQPARGPHGESPHGGHCAATFW